MIRSIVSQVYFQSGTIVPVTIVVALGQRGKAFCRVSIGIKHGLVRYGDGVNYFYLRIKKHSFYTGYNS